MRIPVLIAILLCSFAPARLSFGAQANPMSVAELAQAVTKLPQVLLNVTEVDRAALAGCDEVAQAVFAVAQLFFRSCPLRLPMQCGQAVAEVGG